jgi:serine/threonine-protein kinase
MSGAAEVSTGVFALAAYEIRDKIGTGQFGIVYRAWSEARGDEIALKHIRAEGVDGGIKVPAEERGAALQRRFSSRYPNLVPEIYECGRAENGDYCIAMELVLGRPLTELIRSARLDTRRAAELAAAIGDFLVKLHGLSDGEEPILHSDLKPEHVLVREDGSLRVLDLGIAKSLQANKSLTGNAWASAPYASPERLDDGLVRAGDDYWALGVMLFEMVAGYHPYHAYMSGDNNATLARAIRRTEPPAPLPSSCDPGLAAAIRKMLAPQAAHRYQTAAEIVADLRNYLEGRETIAAAENALASQRTQIIPQPETAKLPAVLPDTVPTDPLPVAASAAGAGTMRRRSRVSAIAAAVRMLWRNSRPLARVAFAFIFVLVALTEGASWIRAERFRERIGSLKPSDVPAVRVELGNIRSLTFLGSAVPVQWRAQV